MLGIYLHVPFCVSKCPYCDFYSVTQYDGDLLDRYTDALCARLSSAAERLCTAADTLYFGGGTPSLLGGRRLTKLIDCAAKGFSLSHAEITLEANPADDLEDTFRDFQKAGGNRLSLGMQAVNDAELRVLGRRHTAAMPAIAVQAAHKAGINNISLDLMLATPGQTDRSVTDAVKVCQTLGAAHVSAYLLKIEPQTPFAKCANTLDLPDDDTAADRYLLACEALENAGFRQYEISNFAKPGMESRHNLKYWNGEPYLGLGPAAHSFIDGRRWQFSRDLSAFLRGATPTLEDPKSDLPDGSPAEYAMLRLRLTDGLSERLFLEKFGTGIPDDWKRRAASLPPHLVISDEGGIRLTRQGFLLENLLIARILGKE